MEIATGLTMCCSVLLRASEIIRLVASYLLETNITLDWTNEPCSKHVSRI